MLHYKIPSPIVFPKHSLKTHCVERFLDGFYYGNAEITKDDWKFHYKPLDKNEELWDDYPDEYYETILLFCFLNKKKAF